MCAKADGHCTLAASRSVFRYSDDNDLFSVRFRWSFEESLLYKSCSLYTWRGGRKKEFCYSQRNCHCHKISLHHSWYIYSIYRAKSVSLTKLMSVLGQVKIVHFQNKRVLHYCDEMVAGNNDLWLSDKNQMVILALEFANSAKIIFIDSIKLAS